MIINHKMVVSLAQPVLLPSNIHTERVEADHVLHRVIKEAVGIILGETIHSLAQHALENGESVALRLGGATLEGVVKQHIKEFADECRGH